jgi:hypothetical protein
MSSARRLQNGGVNWVAIEGLGARSDMVGGHGANGMLFTLVKNHAMSIP